MPVRPLDLLDLPTVHRYRRAALTLDSAPALTRGDPLGPVGLLAYLNLTRHIYTAVCTDSLDGLPLLGGVTHDEGETFARLSFLAPRESLDTNALPSLLEHLAMQAGKWGAFHVLAEVDEHTPVFKSLRQVGFAVYAWQRFWELTTLPAPKTPSADWQPARESDLPAIQGLYWHIVPAMLQAVEVCPKRAGGLVYRADGELQAHVGLMYGPRGILIQPLIHPDADYVSEQLAGLVHNLPNRRGRRVYLCMRSYQTWLEPVLEDLGAGVGPRQAVMVKHLTASLRAERAIAAKRETAWAKPATPLARSHPKS